MIYNTEIWKVDISQINNWTCFKYYAKFRIKLTNRIYKFYFVKEKD